MAAVFLASLFEYSPLFYTTLFSLCFVLTAIVVFGGRGFDVPVLLRRSEETEPILPPPEKPMVQVTNPFGLELLSGPASLAAGVGLRAKCLTPSVLSCFWGCEVGALQRALQAHRRGLPPSGWQQPLRSGSLHCQRFPIGGGVAEEHHTGIPACQGVSHLGPLPRQRYPLVALLTLAEQEGNTHIAASLSVVHVPDSTHAAEACILFQYLLTAQGNLYELKSLFMSTDGGQAGPSPGTTHRHQQAVEEAAAVAASAGQEEEEGGRDCVVCQSAAVSVVLLPCRHACVCHSCSARFQACPICRAAVLESFALTGNQ